MVRCYSNAALCKTLPLRASRETEFQPEKPFLIKSSLIWYIYLPAYINWKESLKCQQKYLISFVFVLTTNKDHQFGNCCRKKRSKKQRLVISYDFHHSQSICLQSQKLKDHRLFTRKFLGNQLLQEYRKIFKYITLESPELTWMSARLVKISWKQRRRSTMRKPTAIWK